MKIQAFRCNEFAENCYVAYDDESLEAFIVDPGMKYENEWQQVFNYVSEHKLNIKYIFVTHYHLDHIFGTGKCVEEFGVELSGSIEDQLGLPSPQIQSQMFGLPFSNTISSITNNIVEGDKLLLGSKIIEVIDCPGHSHHGLCFYVPSAKALFSGDVLFYCSIGRSDFGRQMGGDGMLLVEGITTKLLILPSDVVVYPGHGPITTIEKEIKHNPYI